MELHLILMSLNGSQCLCPEPVLLGSSVLEQEGSSLNSGSDVLLVVMLASSERNARALGSEQRPSRLTGGVPRSARRCRGLGGPREQPFIPNVGEGEQGAGRGERRRQLGWAGCGAVETRRPSQQPSISSRPDARQLLLAQVGAPPGWLPQTRAPQVPVRACTTPPWAHLGPCPRNPLPCAL